MSSASSMCQTYPAYTSDAPEDVSTALHGSGEGALCTQGHASCGSPLYQLRARESHAAHALIRWLQFDESWLVAIPGRRTTTASP